MFAIIFFVAGHIGAAIFFFIVGMMARDNDRRDSGI